MEDHTNKTSMKTTETNKETKTTKNGRQQMHNDTITATITKYKTKANIFYLIS